jgi:hypothetical protein
MNIIKLQNMLRGVDDNALINYVQNPQGEVPSYLALSELQRRKDTRAKYQAQQAPETSVAEDLEQETMSDQGGLAMLAGQPQMQMEDQGVASLPVDDNMYDEENFAGGGIVAFAPGGPVYPNYEGPATSAIGRGLSSITGGLKGYVDKKSQLMDIQRQIETLQPNLFESLTPSELSTRKSKIAELKAKQDAIRYPTSGYEYKEGESAVDPTMKSYVDQEVARKLETQKEKPKATEGKPATTTNQTPAAQTAQQTAETDEDYLRRRMALFKEAMGPNEDRTKLQEKIDKMEKRAARQEELAPYMALTEAGFKTMAGTSPFALANLGAGAQAGLQSYGAAQDKMAALEEKRYALMNEAAKADRAERQAIAKFGFDSEEAKMNRDQKERLGQAELEVRREANAINRTRFSNEAKYLKMAGFGQRNQAAIDKYVKDRMGTDSIILENLRKMDPAKLDDKKKALLKSYAEKEARIQQEAIQKYDVNNLVDRARPGSAGTQFRSSDYTVEELPGQ